MLRYFTGKYSVVSTNVGNNKIALFPVKTN